MSKRSRTTVASELHSELSEYSFLLRSIRAADTLDLTSRLTAPKHRAASATNATPDPALLPEDSDEENSRDSNGWTRWPLEAGEVNVPEFGFAEEVRLLLRTALSQQQPADSSSAIQLSDDTDSQELVRDTVNSSHAFLSSLLAQIANHGPRGPASMSNRVGPSNWECIANILGTSGVVHPE